MSLRNVREGHSEEPAQMGLPRKLTRPLDSGFGQTSGLFWSPIGDRRLRSIRTMFFESFLIRFRWRGRKRCTLWARIGIAIWGPGGPSHALRYLGRSHPPPSEKRGETVIRICALVEVQSPSYPTSQRLCTSLHHVRSHSRRHSREAAQCSRRT